MSQELLDKIRYRKNNPSSIDWREAIGEERALKWVLRLFKEHEKSMKRRVLFEKIKQSKPRNKSYRRPAPEEDDVQHMTINMRSALRLGGLGGELGVGIGGWGITI